MAINPNPIDIHVGGQVKQRRILLGLSMVQVAKHFDLTFQQIQKYENGSNRISASKLFKLSQILMVPIAYFFEGLDENGVPQDVIEPNLTKRETLEMVR